MVVTNIMCRKIDTNVFCTLWNINSHQAPLFSAPTTITSRKHQKDMIWYQKQKKNPRI